MISETPSPPKSEMTSEPKLRSLYICYFPITEPLVQTQVVAYLEGLATHGHTVHLLTFETEVMSAAQKQQWRKRLKQQGITWHTLRYHKRPSLPATLYDSLCGVLLGLKLIRRYRLQAVHARGHVPAAMALLLKKLLGTKLIFDIRGLWAEEYEDAGIWARGSLPFRLTKAVEKQCVEAADGIVVLTERVRKVLFIDENAWYPHYKAALQVIPCCADLSQIENLQDERETLRRELNLQDKTVLVYVGKFGGWYMQAEMVDFFAQTRHQVPDLHFLVLTQSDPEMIRSEFARRNVPESEFTILRSAPERVGAYLAASDVALSFIAAFPSKIASSPTKLGEYLAAGLPVVCNPGVGDVDLIIEEHHAGVIVPSFSDEAYAGAARELQELIGSEPVRERCRRAAYASASLQEIGVPRYHELYTAVASQTK